MCQTTVYLDEEKIMEDVIWVKPVAGGIEIHTFFDEPVFIQGVITGIDLLKHRILLVSSGKTHQSSEEGINK